MPTVKIDAQLSKSDLIQAAQQLSPTELSEFTQEILRLNAQKKVPSLNKKEADLLIEINKGIDPDIHQQYQNLIQKRDLETLSETEYQKLIELTDIVEAYQVQVLENVAQLAQLRQVSFSTLVEQLGIQVTSL
ncbi:MAG: STAS/SEC14 domain-containing protein [Spirulinaceae cyanobacterium]